MHEEQYKLGDQTILRAEHGQIALEVMNKSGNDNEFLQRTRAP